MPPHLPRPGQHPPHHPHAIVSDERDRSPEAAGQILSAIGTRLSETGGFSMNGIEVIPADPCFFELRVERMPHGAMSIKVNIEWPETTRAEGDPVGELTIA